MRNGILASLGILLAGTNIAFGQGYYPGYPPAGFYPPQPPPPVWQMQGLPQQMPMQQYPVQQVQMQQYPVQPYPAQQYPVQQMPMQPMPWRPQPMPTSPPMMPQQYYQNGMRDYPQPYYPMSRSAGPAAGQPAPDADIPLPAPAPSKNTPDTEKNTPPAFPSVDYNPAHDDPGPSSVSPQEIPGRVPPGFSVYAQAEFLYWWFRKPDGPILFNNTGPLGTVNLDPRSLMDQQDLGPRFTLGAWLDQDLAMSIEGSGFYMGNRQAQTTLTPDLTINRPYFDLSIGAPTSVPLSPGSTGILTNRMRLYGAEFNLRWEICRGSFGHIDFLTGPRFLQLDESIDMQTTDPGFQGLGIITITTDNFGTHNQFWGWQVGLEGEANWGPFFLKGYAKVAPGDLVQTVNIAGDTNTNGVDAPGGFLAQPTNIGQYTRNRFGVLPEAGFNVGIKFNEHVRIYGGYSVFFLANAVRPGDQIDNNINFSGTTPPGPLFNWKETTFWAQGCTVGLEIRY